MSELETGRSREIGGKIIVIEVSYVKASAAKVPGGLRAVASVRLACGFCGGVCVFDPGVGCYSVM